MPVLDGNIDDGLSDARSLAASMKGNLANILINHLLQPLKRYAQTTTTYVLLNSTVLQFQEVKRLRITIPTPKIKKLLNV